MESNQNELENIQELFNRDPYLKPFETEIRRRFVKIHYLSSMKLA
jgi:hypothetical protein